MSERDLAHELAVLRPKAGDVLVCYVEPARQPDVQIALLQVRRPFNVPLVFLLPDERLECVGPERLRPTAAEILRFA